MLCLLKEDEEPASAEVDTDGKRPRRKAAVSASKSLRATTRDSPDSVPSDDEYKAGSGEEAEEAVSDDDDMGGGDEEEDEDDAEL